MTDYRDAPTPPLLPGQLVAYQRRDGQLCGGADDRAHGTVLKCERVPGHRAFTVILTDGQRIPLRMIRSVSKVNASGGIISAWIVEHHGFDGKGPK